MIPERLTRVLETHRQKLNLSTYEVSKLQGDASSRVYYRIRHDANATSWIAMVLPENQPSSLAEEITKVSGAVTELPFINIQKFLKPSLNVPEILIFDEKAGVLILEDFGDDLLLAVIQKSNPTLVEKLYQASLDELYTLCLLGKKTTDSVAFQRKYDLDLYNWEFLHFVEYAIDKPLAGKVSASDRQEILKALYAISERYTSWDQLLCHRDYHSRNLIVLNPETPSIGIIDFQDALLAPIFYDLASLLRDSYYKIDPEMQSRLVEYYRKKFSGQELKMTSSPDEFRFAFDLMGLQRNMKAAGRFFYIDIVKHNPSFLKDVPRTLGYIGHSIETYPELKKLRQYLLPILSDISAKAS